MLKEITWKRIARWMLASLIVMLFIAYGFGVGIASASSITGNLTIEQLSPFQYQDGAGGVPAGVPTMTIIDWDSTDFTYISWFRISDLTSYTLSKNQYSSRIECVTNCIGGGWVSYDQGSGTGKNITYVFDTTTTFQGSPITISYTTTDFPSTITWTSMTTTGGASSCDYLSSTKPVCIRASVTTKSLHALYNPTLSVRTVNQYNATYINTVLGLAVNISVIKDGVIATKVKVENVIGGIFTQEASTNTNNYNTIILDNGTGLILNISLIGGAYNKAFVNTTAPNITTTINNQTIPGIGGSPSGQIYYHYDPPAMLGERYGINVSISEENWSSINLLGIPYTQFFIFGYYCGQFCSTTFIPPVDDTWMLTGFPVKFTSQQYNTSKMFVFGSNGVFRAVLAYCPVLQTSCSNAQTSINGLTIIDTAQINLNDVGNMGFSITTDKATYQPGDTMKITVVNPSTNPVFLTAYGKPGIVEQLAWNTKVLSGTSILTRLIPQNIPVGDYVINMATTESYSPKVAQVLFNISFPSSTSNTLFVAWDDTQHATGATGVVYTTSNFNSSTLSVRSPGGIIKIFSFSANSSNQTLIILNEGGIWNATIRDDGNASNFKTAQTGVGLINPKSNDTFSVCKGALTYVCWDKKQYSQGEAFSIEFKLQSSIYDVLNPRPYIEISNPSGNVIINRSVNSSWDVNENFFFGTLTGNFAPNAPIGLWWSRLITNPIIGERSVKAESVTEVVQGIPSTQGGISGTGGSGSQQATALIGMLTSGMFWSLLITGGLMLAIAWRTRDGLPTGIIGVLSMGAFTFIGMMPAWIFFSVFIIAALLIAGSVVEKQTRNVTK